MTLDHVCFVYGTLTDPDRVADVLEPVDSADWDAATSADRGAATLRGLHRVDGEYPTLAPGEQVDGNLLAVNRAGLDALDAYEGVERGLYVRVSIPCTHPTVDGSTVWTYVGDPDRLDADAAWSGDGPFESRVRATLDELDVTVGLQG